MAFKTWRTGVHILEDKVLAVALTREKQGWNLRRWWQIALAPDLIRDGKILQPEPLAAQMRTFSQSLPRNHRVFLAFPASRTLQKTLPYPAVALRDSEQATWISSVMSRELEMAPDALCFDYSQDTFSRSYHVTAAQNKEVATLLTLADTLRLHMAAITPDASALAHLLPLLSAPCVAWRDKHQWLWAMRHQWGRKSDSEAQTLQQLAALLAIRDDDISCFENNGNDPLSLVTCCYPPLPENGADFTVALALAMGDVFE